MTPQEARDWLKFLDDRNKGNFNLEVAAFKQQRDFIKDPARLKALFCTRRAAKSYTGGIYIIDEALKYPGSNLLYLALTRETAKGIIWKDILKTLNSKFKLNMSFNGTAITATLPNGSVIWVTGADSDEDEMNKLLGRKYRLAIIDEASMFSVNLKRLVEGVLGPAMSDLKGTICMMGTASNNPRGYFFDITNGKEQGWSIHRWTAYENPYSKWDEEIKEIEEKRPAFKETNLFKQWYLNQWVIDEDALVYKFLSKRNETDHLPACESPWHYVLGIDLGHSPDPSAFNVAAYNDESPVLYLIHSEKHLKMDITAVADKIKELDQTYNFEAKVIDGSMKMAIAEMNSRHGCNVIPADKQGKEHWINLLNSDLIQSRIQFLPASGDLKKELQSLVWVTDADGKMEFPRKEHPKLDNHLCDAFLYLWRYTHAYLHTKPLLPEKIDWTNQKVWEPKHIQNLSEQVRDQQNPYRWDQSFKPDDDLFDFEKDEVI